MDREWMTEACDRLVEESEHTRHHYQQVNGFLDEVIGDMRSGMSLMDFATKMGGRLPDEFMGECLSLLNHLFLIHGAVQVMLSEAWNSPVIPGEVKAEAARQQIELQTGSPFEVIGMVGGGALLGEVEVEVPDDLRGIDGLDEEGEANGE